MSFLSFLGSWLVIVGFIWKVFGDVDDLFSSEVKQKLSNGLKSTNYGSYYSAAVVSFNNLSDKLFGKSIISFRSLAVSAALSLGSAYIITLLWIAIDTRFLDVLIQSGFIKAVLIIPIFLNIIPDFLSIIETRLVAKLLTRTKSIFLQFVILVFDFFVTMAIFTMCWHVLIVGILNHEGNYHGSYYLLFIEVLESIAIFGPNFISISSFDNEAFHIYSFFSIFAFTTLTTSVWLWLHLASIHLIKLSPKIGKLNMLTEKYLNIEEKPFKSAGFLMVTFITLVYVLAIIPVFIWNQ